MTERLEYTHPEGVALLSTLVMQVLAVQHCIHIAHHQHLFIINRVDLVALLLLEVVAKLQHLRSNH